MVGGDTSHGEGDSNHGEAQYDTSITLFITRGQTFYLLSSLRDAAMAEWMHRCGNALIIFKQHYDQFEKEVLMPLQECYAVERKKAGRVR